MFKHTYLRNITLISTFLIALTLVSCDNATSPESSSQNQLFKQTHSLKNRITIINKPQKNLFHSNTEKGAAAQKTTNISLNISLVMTIAPPSGDLIPRTAASHLYLDTTRNQVYISYLIPKKEYGGGFDRIDANVACYQENSPEDCNHSSSFITNQMDVGAATTTDNYFYASGSVNYEHDGMINGIDFGSFKSPAAVFRTPVDNFSVGNIQNADLSSFSATDIKTRGGNVYVTTGADSGDVYKLDQDLNVSSSNSVTSPDFRSMALSNDKLYTLNADGKIYSTALGSNDFSLTSVLSAGSGIRDYTIAKMSYSDKNGGRLYVPLNDSGFKVFDANSASGEAIDNDPSFYCTSLTVGKNYIYAAGADSSLTASAVADSSGAIRVYQWSGDNNQTLEKIGSVEIAGYQSNLIKAVGDYLFVASGKEGVTVLKIDSKLD